MVYEEILNLPMKEDNSADAKDIRAYLWALLDTLWHDGEYFSGKRPHGNSGWDWEIYHALIVHGIVEGKLDKYGDIESVDEEKAHGIVNDLIHHIFYG